MNNSCVEETKASEAEPGREDADALFILGIRYSTGRDVDHDPIAAHKWFNLAAMMGHEGALTARAELARELKPAQIAEAQRQARAWLWNRNAPAETAGRQKAAEVRPLYVRRRAEEMRSAKSFARAIVS